MIIWWFTFLLHGVFALPLCPNQQTSKDHVMLSALLPLHSGDDCSEIQIRGLQQLAALEYGLSKVNIDLNQYGDIKINLQILDTCSNSSTVVKTTMKGLVSAEQFCIKNPLLLGYVGPDDLESFISVHKITSLLNKMHVLPYKIDLSEKPANALFIGTDQTGIRAKAILLMLKNLDWKSYVPVIEDSVQCSILLDTLVDISDRQICPIKKTTTIPKTDNGYTTIYKEIMEVYTPDGGILVIVEKPDALKPLLKILSNSVSVQRPSFVVYIISVGLKLWELPKSDSLKMVIMQEATDFKVKNEIKQHYNSSLLINYYEQTRSYKRNCKNDPMCLDSIEDELDSTVMPIVYSVHLFANALKIAIDQKCKYNSGPLGLCRNFQSMPPTEWISLLKTASTIMNWPDGPKRVRFSMEITHHVSIYMWNMFARKFELIGSMINGNKLDLMKNVILPNSIRTTGSDRLPSCQSYKTKLLKTTTESMPVEEATVAKEDDWSPIWDFLPNVDKNSKIKDTYNVIIVMLCIGLGFLIFMIVTIRMLYNMFKFKQGIEEPSSKKRKKMAAKRNKRTSSVTSRRFSRASSIISSRST